MTNSPQFKVFPHYINVTRQDDGLLRVKTNTHVLPDVPEDQLGWVVYPYAGQGLHVELKIEEQELYDKVFAALEKATDLHTFFTDEHPVLAQAYTNWNYFYKNKDRFKSLRSLEGAANGRTIVFAGAGPSFLEQQDTIKKLMDEDKIILIAGGSAIRQCCSAGIIPHLCLAFDPRISEEHVVFDHLTDEFLSKTSFVINQGLYHPCVKRIQKAYVTSSSSIADMCRYIEPEEVVLKEGRIGVATMVPFLAEHMKASKIVYIGVDLSLADDGRRYTDIEDPTFNEVGDKFIEHEGFKTRLAWVREAADIAQTRTLIDVPLFNASKSSMLTVTTVPFMGLDLLDREIPEKLKIVDIDKDQSYDDIRGKLECLHGDFKRLLHSGEGFTTCADLQATEAFKGAVATYHMLQQFREARTGDYNHSLLKLFMMNNIKWLDSALGEG